MASVNYYQMHWLRQVANALAKYESVTPEKVQLYLSPRDQFRLMTWKAWCFEYQVDLGFILQALLPRFKRWKRRFQKRITLGVPVRSITGLAARGMLEEAVSREFPNSEHIKAQREELKRRMVGNGVVRVASSSPSEFVEQYRQWVKRKRRSYEKAEAKFSRRSWRGNPWKQ